LDISTAKIKDDKKLGKSVFYVEFLPDTKNFPTEIPKNPISLSTDLRKIQFATIWAKELGGVFDYESEKWFFDKEKLYNETYERNAVKKYEPLLDAFEADNPKWLEYVNKRFEQEV